MLKFKRTILTWSLWQLRNCSPLGKRSRHDF
jgi:hypothetical protein